MKKIILSMAFMLIGVFAFANYESASIYNYENINKEENNQLCRVTCEQSWTTHEGVTYTFSASAGSIFTSCETAIERCQRKLNSLLYWE